MATRNNTLSQLAPSADDGRLVDSFVTRGDISGLNPAERTRLYVRLCDSLGLNPATQPLAVLRLNGKEVLYPTRGATDQLAAIHRLNREIIDGPRVIDLAGTKLVMAVCRATHPNGRVETAIATVPLSDAQNVLMKVETKAKRRATLSILGLGMLDETEIESIPASARSPAAQIVVPAEELDSANGDNNVFADWCAKIAEARSLGELTTLARKIRSLPASLREQLRPVYETRRKELQGPPDPTPVTPSTGGPANDGGSNGAAANAETPPADVPAAWTVREWRAYLDEATSPPHVLNKVRAHFGEIPIAIRRECLNVAVRRLARFRSTAASARDLISSIVDELSREAA